jgi:hypothetical protein
MRSHFKTTVGKIQNSSGTIVKLQKSFDLTLFSLLTRKQYPLSTYTLFEFTSHILRKSIQLAASRTVSRTSCPCSLIHHACLSQRHRHSRGHKSNLHSALSSGDALLSHTSDRFSLYRVPPARFVRSVCLVLMLL